MTDSTRIDQNEHKVKVLLFGQPDKESDGVQIVSKLTMLHSSKAGPFHIAFVIGSMDTKQQRYLIDTLRNGATLPVPTYIQDTPILNAFPKAENDIKEATQQAPFFQIAKNLYVLRDKDTEVTCAGIWKIPIPVLSSDKNSTPYLIVASCPPRFRIEDSANFFSKLSHDSYSGCDFLLSSEWPQGIEKVVTGFDCSNTSTISFDVAEVARRARAKYHVSVSTSATNFQFVQSPLFRHYSTAEARDKEVFAGRFVSLSPISTSKETLRKCVHAVGIVPVDTNQFKEPFDRVVPCPFLETFETPELKLNSGLSLSSAQMILSEQRSIHQQQGITGNRWKSHGEKRSEMCVDAVSSMNLGSKTLFVYGLQSDITGRLQSSNDGASDQRIVNALLSSSPATSSEHIRQVRRPGGSSFSSFCFVEFISHDTAATCLMQCGGSVMVDGVILHIKWGTHASHKDEESTRVKMEKYDRNCVAIGSKRRRLTGAEARDSSTLYFKFVPSSSTFHSFNFPLACNVLRAWTEHTLEEALHGEDDNAGDRLITAEEEPALQVRLQPTLTSDHIGTVPSAWSLRNGISSTISPDERERSTIVSNIDVADSRKFGFLCFASHAAASLVLVAMTGSTDGGRVITDIPFLRKPLATFDSITNVENEINATSSAKLDVENKNYHSTSNIRTVFDHVQVYLNWAQNPTARQHNDTESGQRHRSNKLLDDEASGVNSQRKHFSVDSRQDCWFCLASVSCEKHLIVSVYEKCYLAMPKGPIHRGHVLLIPVQHTDCGIWNHTDNSVTSEILKLLQQIRTHVNNAFDCDLFVFERAIATKGGYHSHIQCIPVAKNLGSIIESTVLAEAAKSGFDLERITSDFDMNSLTGTDACLSDGESEVSKIHGYFYCEIPTINRGEYVRLLHQSPTNGQHNVPIQFGRQVMAAVLGKPDLAHWKSCVADRNEEETMAMELRASFSKCLVDNQ